MPGSPQDGFGVSDTVLEFNMFVSETKIDYNILLAHSSYSVIQKT